MLHLHRLEVDNKLHLARIALARATGDGNDWELARWDIPVRRGIALFDRPTISKGLVS